MLTQRARLEPPEHGAFAETRWDRDRVQNERPVRRVEAASEPEAEPADDGRDTEPGDARDVARGYRRGSLNAKSSPAYCAPLTATTRYCSPFSMYVIGEPLCGAGM